MGEWKEKGKNNFHPSDLPEAGASLFTECSQMRETLDIGIAIWSGFLNSTATLIASVKTWSEIEKNNKAILLVHMGKEKKLELYNAHVKRKDIKSWT